ncbi:MAG: hypothetical protein OMM_00123 [Candidatus Magnetoglobus multicellularis str. Araruama]|uniref:Uncharacterized protein n=1 Tax=Candidatus Magnetoglobus multicellularis str. Araruama TaxID=890399 RepID=A0A1V1PID7_9BACT|nr:MAG: hypothetical protein OMM_00123 [Candidatus Magnetoglobus multicellularis str. Araruama]
MFSFVGLISSSIAYLLQNIPYTANAFNSSEQSYYLAESGLRYAIMKIQQETDVKDLQHCEIRLPQKPGNKMAGNILLKFDEQGRSVKFIESFAQVDQHSFAPSLRSVNAEYDKSIYMDNIMKKDDFDQDDGDRKWIISNSFKADSFNISPVLALKFKSNRRRNWMLASLNWANNKHLQDLRLWQFPITKVLSYKLQVKVNCYPGDGQEGKDFMAGLNFRVMNSNQIKNKRIAYYGVSLFKSAGRKQGNPPCWLIPDSTGCGIHLNDSFRFEGEDPECLTGGKCLKPNTPYIIFWIKSDEDEDIELLAYSNLRHAKNSDELVTNLSGLEWGFKDWLTLAVFLNEKESAGQKINEVQVGIRPNDGNWELNWEFPEKLKFEKLRSDDLSSNTVVRDRTLISQDLSQSNQILPDEMGFHALYDNRLSSFYEYNIYFNDFYYGCYGNHCPTNDGLPYTQY